MGEAAAAEFAKNRDKRITQQLKRQQEELDFFIASQGQRAKSQERELEIAQQVLDKELALLESQLEAKKISQLKF